MNAPVFALIDCNNFFVSCEKVFRPDLEGKPVVVLSSNDGCAVARSNEAKALGIAMAAPAFKYRDLFKQHNVVQFSANFDLYGDMSRRITELLTTITPRIEIYSVDESFLDLSQLPIQDYTAWAQGVREAIWRWTGIPVSIGIAPTKTLAKLASERAKKDPELNGTLSFMDMPQQVAAQQLHAVPVADVWGIGWRLTPKMRAEGISTAYQLSQLRPQRAQQLMGIKGRQLIAELNGVSCYPLGLEERLPKSIARTRTFGEDTNQSVVVESALASFAAQAAFRLRRSGQLTRRAALFATTNKHKPGYRRWSREVVYDVPTADTSRIISDLIGLWHQLYKPQQSYHRAGVLLYDFAPSRFVQTDLMGYIDIPLHDAATRRMQAVDTLNERFGKRTIRNATELLAQTWRPRYNLRSPRYTTHPGELPQARIIAH